MVKKKTEGNEKKMNYIKELMEMEKTEFDEQYLDTPDCEFVDSERMWDTLISETKKELAEKPRKEMVEKYLQIWEKQILVGTMYDLSEEKLKAVMSKETFEQLKKVREDLNEVEGVKNDKKNNNT